MNRKFVLWLGAVAILLVCSCNKKQAAQEEAPPRNIDPVDRRADSHLDPEKVVHRVFPVSSHAEFAFSVPAHQRDARLLGTFRSFTKRNAPDSTSDAAADVDMLILDDQQLDDYLHNRSLNAAYELDPSHDHRVEWKVPPTSEVPQAYHLVFSNSSGGAKTKFVEADFTVKFE